MEKRDQIGGEMTVEVLQTCTLYMSLLHYVFDTSEPTGFALEN
jgi:hypothetical protein